MNSPPSSRLDSAIARLMTLRICLDWAAAETLGRPGPVMEFGLGNGRSYDHLRKRLPGRDIHVFDRHVAAHPDCIPPADRLWLGDFRATAPAAVQRFAGELAPWWAALLQDQGLLISDQPIVAGEFGLLELPGGQAGRSFLARRNPR
jgi:S-adenosyl-L-methionine methyltransferase